MDTVPGFGRFLSMSADESYRAQIGTCMTWTTSILARDGNSLSEANPKFRGGVAKWVRSGPVPAFAEKKTFFWAGGGGAEKCQPAFNKRVRRAPKMRVPSEFIWHSFIASVHREPAKRTSIYDGARRARKNICNALGPHVLLLRLEEHEAAPIRQTQIPFIKRYCIPANA